MHFKRTDVMFGRARGWGGGRYLRKGAVASLFLPRFLLPKTYSSPNHWATSLFLFNADTKTVVHLRLPKLFHVINSSPTPPHPAPPQPRINLTHSLSLRGEFRLGNALLRGPSRSCFASDAHAPVRLRSISGAASAVGVVGGRGGILPFSLLSSVYELGSCRSPRIRRLRLLLLLRSPRH